MTTGKDDDEDASTPKPSEQYTKELLWYKNRLKEEQKKNAEYQQISAENFNHAAEEVKRKFELVILPTCGASQMLCY